MNAGFTSLRQGTAQWVARGADESRLDHWLRLAVAAVVLLFPATGLLLDRADSYSLLLLLVAGAVAWARMHFRTGFGRREWWYAGVFLLFFCAGVLAFACGHQTDYGFRLLGRYLRLLLALPALMALRRYRVPALLVWLGLGLGASALGVDAIIERALASDVDQPMGDTNVAILFGDIALLTAFSFAAGYVYVDARLPRLGPKLMWLGTLAGLVACFLSGARGAWLAIPVLLILFLTGSHLLRQRSVLLGGTVILALFALLYAVPQTRVRARLDNALDQMRTYEYVRHSMRESPAPLCLDDPVLLKAWIATGTMSPNPKLHVVVAPAVPDRGQQLTGNGCTRATVLRLVNDSDQPGWLELPHTVRKGHGASVVQLVIAGSGWVSFGTGAHSHLRVGRGFYHKEQLYTFPKDGTRILVGASAHNSIELVPLENYAGEYRDSLLESSVGQRLEMWAVAWQLFLQAPVTGTGTGDYMFGAQKLVDEGAALPVTAIYDHPHNEFLDALSSRGLVGLAALLLLFGVPAWLFARSLGSPDPARMGASLGGLLICIGFPVFGLSETMLVHSVTLGWYVIMTAIFMVTAEGDAVEGTR